MDSYNVYITLPNGSSEALRISPALSLGEVRSQFCAAADVPDTTSNIVLKLYSSDGGLLPIGPHIPANGPESRYRLEIKKAAFILEASSATDLGDDQVSAILSDINKLKEKIEAIKLNGSSSTTTHSHGSKPDAQSSTAATHPASGMPSSRRVQKSTTAPSAPKPAQPAFQPEVMQHLKHPTFDIWQWQEHEMAALLQCMFEEFGLMETYKIDQSNMDGFLQCVRSSYNNNPFHNFRHCFCVTQMMYGLLHVTEVHKKLQPLEKLILLVACIGHDLDHPGFNNAYQVNAKSELSIIYNDVSPLENHHAAVLFTILKGEDTNILSNLSETDSREARKQIIACILATDMAKHGEIMTRFKGYAEAGFNYDDSAQRSLLLQMIVKCADISNEVRPKHVSEPWVDSLLEEFFSQSDREKEEGLPFAPFMDRQKVTKASAQVGFIGFVMIPLFELVSKVLPNMEEPVIQPIRKALEYYKGMAA
ncbi:hypothetical protein DFS34DRAFT_693311 [Phlyctochytrium arcticum]|nr:hypothetical protein DFS34DRAFT_693311 [Phlyctochytrium arcticum]